MLLDEANSPCVSMWSSRAKTQFAPLFATIALQLHLPFQVKDNCLASDVLRLPIQLMPTIAAPICFLSIKPLFPDNPRSSGVVIPAVDSWSLQLERLSEHTSNKVVVVRMLRLVVSMRLKDKFVAN